MSRRAILGLILAFVVTRIVMVHYATDPDSYPLANAPFTADVDVVYHDVAQRIADGEEPYTEFDLEYPPGVIPFLVIPERSWPDLGDYRTGFVRLMVLVDVFGLIGVVRLARRWGSPLGPWAWVVLVALVGPLGYARFDLVPAAATVWAVEGVAAARWQRAGGWLGYGALTKVYPGFLAPLAFMATPRRERSSMAMGFFAVATLTVLGAIAAFGGSPSEMIGDALSARVGTGVHLESTWGSLLLVADRIGYDAPVTSHLSTLFFTGYLADWMSQMGLLLTVAAVALTALATPSQESDGGRGLGTTAFAVLAMVMGVSTVFSPQFVVWLIALGAVVTCVPRPTVGWIPWLLIPVAVMTHYLYPYQYHRILNRDWVGLGVLLGRNLLVLAIGIAAVAMIIRDQGPAGRVARFSSWTADRLRPRTSRRHPRPRQGLPRV